MNWQIRFLRRVPLQQSLQRYSSLSTAPSQWRKVQIVDEWIQREARPVSLRQLTVFGRKLTKARLLESANYVREELPTRLAHRIRDLQNLPFNVVKNPHMTMVYDLYFKALDDFRRIGEITTLDGNDDYCQVLRRNLKEHLSVIPQLVMGLLECQAMLPAEATDMLMNTMLRSRISRRMIAEQHLALTDSYESSYDQRDVVGEIFLECNAKEIVERCANKIEQLCRQAYGAPTLSIPFCLVILKLQKEDMQLPAVVINGHPKAVLTYIPAHLEYMVGELLRNSFQAAISHSQSPNQKPHPIEVLICEAPQHVIFRICDRGGGVNATLLPYLWSFVKGPRRDMKLENFTKVPQLSATLQELKVKNTKPAVRADSSQDTSLTTLTSRPPDLQLGIGLPMSRVYAEYWAGSLNLQNIPGFGVDVFLQVPKLGNRNEQLSTRASMDAL